MGIAILLEIQRAKIMMQEADRLWLALYLLLGAIKRDNQVVLYDGDSEAMA